MSDNIDNILGTNDEPSNLKKKINKEQSNIQNRLKSLKDLLQSDDVQFNTDDHLMKHGDLPAASDIKVIDYELEFNKCIEYASINIDVIILNYIKSDNLLKSDKLNTIKQQHIIQLAELEDLVRKTNRNMIMIQEAIDAGDMSGDMFKFAKEFMVEKRNNIEARSKHLSKCEIYWKNYAEAYGLESKDDEIIRTSEVKDDKEVKTSIMDISQLNDIIDKQLLETKEKNERNKKN